MMCELKLSCNGVAMPIFYQSQPLILSGYYCIIELEIEGLITGFNSYDGIRGPALNSRKGHGFVCSEAAIACQKILEDKSTFIPAAK